MVWALMARMFIAGSAVITLVSIVMHPRLSMSAMVMSMITVGSRGMVVRLVVMIHALFAMVILAGAVMACWPIMSVVWSVVVRPVSFAVVAMCASMAMRVSMSGVG